LAVFFVITHLACGLRVILQAHLVAQSRGEKITWILIATAGVVAIAISAALVGYRMVL